MSKKENTLKREIFKKAVIRYGIPERIYIDNGYTQSKKWNINNIK